MEDEKPILVLTGEDGNAFNILALARKAARQADWEAEKIDAYLDEAMSGTYDDLLLITMRYFNVK